MPTLPSSNLKPHQARPIALAVLVACLCPAVTADPAAPAPPPRPLPPPLARAALGAPVGVAPEPWSPLSGGAFIGPPQAASPDPLVAFAWTPGAFNASQLQSFVVSPVAAGPTPGTPRASFVNASSCVGGGAACGLVVAGNGSLIVDFGVELAGWFEFDSSNLLDADAAELTLGISEFATDSKGGWVGGYKTGSPVKYGAGCGAGASTCTYRLETNGELYEGVRFALITVGAGGPSRPFTITALRCVAQARPLNYTGSFSSAGDPLLERVWWTGAYTIRVLLLPTYMGSVLMDRGDRISWTGDAYVSQSTFYSFASDYSIPLQNLNLTSCDDCCQSIASYCLLFTLSACDYLAQTGDVASFSYFLPVIERKLEEGFRRSNAPFGLHSMRFWGWDDRTGSGFANDTTPETIFQYKLLAIRCWSTFAAAVAPMNASLAAHFRGYADAAMAALRAQPAQPWWAPLGLHAGADAINTGLLTPAEAAGIVAQSLMDIVRLPSLSHFNQYFVLTATGAAGLLDGGVEQARRFWGADILLGATTFFEVGHPELADILPAGPTALPGEQNGWTLLCADWSTGATQWLSRFVLGVRPLEPGFSRALVAPHVAHSMTGVSGSQGTPHGSIFVSAQAGGHVELSAPAGVHNIVLQLSEVLLARIGLAGLALERLEIISVANSTADADAGFGADAETLATDVASPNDAPLLDETRPGGPRARALVLSLAGGRAWHLRVRARDGGGASAAAWLFAPPPWLPATSSPYAPPAYAGRLVASDYETKGSWAGRYGRAGYAFFAFDVSSPGFNPFCGGAGEGNTLSLECLNAGATMAIDFASYGTAPQGLCPNLTVGSCNAPLSLSVVQKACNGTNKCQVDAVVTAFGPDPCYGTNKMLSVVASCSTGGGSSNGGVGNPSDRVVLPSWVASVTVVNSTVGFLGVTASWTNGTSDPRALQDPSDAARRALGVTQPCGGPTSPVDIVLTDAAKAAGKRFLLSLYFVDYGAAPACTALDGRPRSQELLLMTGYPSLNPLAPRLLLSGFGGGAWLQYELPAGDVRVRISTVTGDMAVLSAIAFDEV
jgi:hypothetical protein